MAPIAAVVVPALALQLLLHQQPQWSQLPTVVVETDRPQAKILWANVHARRSRILPGMSYAAARSLAQELRAGVIDPLQIAEACTDIFVKLSALSPRVEPIHDDPGAYLLDPSGMVPLYGSLESWAKAVELGLATLGFRGMVVVGHHRFLTYVLARCTPGMTIVPTAAQERRIAQRVPLSQLPLSPQLRSQLWLLNVTTLGDLLRLPPAELRSRFGPEAAQLHHQAQDQPIGLQPEPPPQAIGERLCFEPALSDHAQVLFALRRALHPLLAQLTHRGQALTRLHLHILLDHAPPHPLTVSPARPTCDDSVLIDLIRLRLEGLSLAAPITEIEIELEGSRIAADQISLFPEPSTRNLEAGAHALAQIQARFGSNAVTRPVLRAGHLPESRFIWEPVRALVRPCPVDPHNPPPLIRRLYTPPKPLSPPMTRGDPHDLPLQGAVKRWFGPFRISGGWWVRTVERDYYYALMHSGQLLWIYYDGPRQRWYLHAMVD